MASKKLIDKYYDGDSLTDAELHELSIWASGAAWNLLHLGQRFVLAERAASEIVRFCEDALAARKR